ncbi:MAG: hypothetical protein WD402_07700, partial [Chloroflexota bacterium]
QYVLAHEIGHYLGLCHYGHAGPQNVMWRPDMGWLDWGLANYYLESQPHFTSDDARNAWRFIVNQMPQCLVGTGTQPTIL